MNETEDNLVASTARKQLGGWLFGPAILLGCMLLRIDYHGCLVEKCRGDTK